MNMTIKSAMLLVLALLYGACSSSSSSSKRDEQYYKKLLSGMKADATSVLQEANGSHVEGRAVFIVVGDPADHVVGMAIEVKNLAPGKHALHVHQFGVCSADAKSAGGHWNPTNKPHGKRNSDNNQFHKGDIANIEVGEQGEAFWFGDIQGWSIGGATDSDIRGKALIIHDGEDDFTSQPSGNAGMRVACGVIE